ncbi:hypothetical protein MUK42_34436 [Musa troglodytarum]|uniref:Uncharacterized protein n=1 Tax=Musa troglodytarum TaxID=320322 RepID=A0A9E7HM02_9LILI|nr:hypothetical protein MUK42_34436 [Musa troglodytarum]
MQCSCTKWTRIRNVMLVSKKMTAREGPKCPGCTTTVMAADEKKVDSPRAGCSFDRYLYIKSTAALQEICSTQGMIEFQLGCGPSLYRDPFRVAALSS